MSNSLIAKRVRAFLHGQGGAFLGGLSVGGLGVGGSKRKVGRPRKNAHISHAAAVARAYKAVATKRMRGEHLGRGKISHAAAVTRARKAVATKRMRGELHEESLKGWATRRKRGSAFLGGVRGISPWISYVKEYAAQNGISYREALSEAGPSYRASMQGHGYY